MKFFRKCAMTASMMCAASAAQAQYYPYAAPATLPAPAQSRQMAYQNWASYNGQNEQPDSPAPPPPVDNDPNPHNTRLRRGYDEALSANEGPAGAYGEHGACGSGCCDEAFLCGGGQGLMDCCGTRWYGGLSGLYMTRNSPNPYQLSFDTTNPVGELMLNTYTSQEDWQGGFELTLGRYIGSNSALEVSYWTLDNFSGSASAFDPAGVGGLNTPLDFRSLVFDDGVTQTPVNDWYDGAAAHRLTRRDEVHSVEVNFVNYPMLGNNCSRVQMNWFGGLRWFQFQEGWSFDSADTDPEFGADPANEAYYRIKTQNNLLGLQVGGRANFCLSHRLSLYATPRFGVYWNSVEQHSLIQSGNGLTALDVQSERDVVSLMGQLDVGVNYQLSQRWAAFAGYRVLAATGIALADEQVPYLQDDLFGISDIDHNSNLVLHGATAGVRFNF